jgi:group I intron endonuclease
MQKQKIPKECGVYKITSPNGRVYIGSSVNLRSRYSNYKLCPSVNQKLLYRSILKYGFDNHLFEIICICNPSKRLELERYYGEKFNSLSDKGGLNLILPKSGEKPAYYSKETIERFKEIARNRKPSKETREKLSKAKIGLYKNEKHPSARLILNTQSGIFYGCIKEAAESIDMKRSTLSMKLTGRNINNTNFIYA